MRLISFRVSTDHSYNYKTSKYENTVTVQASVELEDETKMDIQFRPDLVPIVINGVLEMVQVAVNRTAVPMKAEKMENPLKALPMAKEIS